MLYVQLLLNGISLGGVFALLAYGIVLIYKSTGVLNFAHGSLAMFCTYVYFAATIQWHLPVVVALGLALFAGAMLGAASYRFLFARMHGAGLLAKVIASLALAGVFQGAAATIWRNNSFAKPPLLFKGSARFATHLALSWQEVVTVLLTVALGAGLMVLLRATTFGIALRATAQNRPAAQMLGVRERRVAQIAWALGGASAALAGVLVVPLGALTVYSMAGFMVRGFVAAVVGGFVSIPAAIVGGFGLGSIQEIVKGTPASSISGLVAGLVIAVLLLARIERFFALDQELRALEELG